ncbi:MAG: hypothetical protein BWY85_01588 [Firmicutes bacterium ADurb.Bin506]|nr:MAG: hypothetical protein BWY85_01588 [Firmicutes bacterium ADurb.Bin506]
MADLRDLTLQHGRHEGFLFRAPEATYGVYRAHRALRIVCGGIVDNAGVAIAAVVGVGGHYRPVNRCTLADWNGRACPGRHGNHHEGNREQDWDG